MNVIQTHALCYFFKSMKVLHDLCLEVPQGSIYGFLGANGTGKTTTIRILLGLTRVHAGKVSIFNREISLDREAILQHIDLSLNILHFIII